MQIPKETQGKGTIPPHSGTTRRRGEGGCPDDKSHWGGGVSVKSGPRRRRVTVQIVFPGRGGKGGGRKRKKRGRKREHLKKRRKKNIYP